MTDGIQVETYQDDEEFEDEDNVDGIRVEADRNTKVEILSETESFVTIRKRAFQSTGGVIQQMC